MKVIFDFTSTKEAYVNSCLTKRVALSKRLKKHKSNCCYSICNNVAIKSHVFSKESSLRSISENGKVLIYRPEIKDRIIRLIPREIGIDDASTFRGFCSAHERMFYPLDQNGITTLRDALLQSYRCLAKWIDNDRTAQAHTDAVIDSLKDLIPDEFRQVVNEHQSINPDIPNVMTRVMYEILERILTKETDKEESTIQACNEITSDLMLLYHRLDYQLPLAMNARNLLAFRYDAECRFFCVFCILVPEEEKTDVLVLLDGGHIAEISGFDVRWFWANLCTHEIAMLEYIETIMMSCEEWCIRPSAIYKLSPLKKANIDFDLRYKCFNSKFFDLIHYTIFEDIWNVLIIKETNEKIKK